MRKLAVVLFLAVVAQCQTTKSGPVPLTAVVDSEISVNSEPRSESKNTLMAQVADPLSASPMSQAIGASVGLGGRPIIKTAVLKPVKVSTLNEERERNSRIWYSLVAFDHAAAGFDAYSTRQAIGHGGQELNPFLKPFADSAAIYPALQVWPTAMDFLGSKMMHSDNHFMRKVWWVPQVASTVTFVSFGFHNLGVHAQ
jgi:hypothetical protein